MSIEQAFTLLHNLRTALKHELENHTLEQLNTIPEGFNNNIFWNIAHCVSVQQALYYRLSGLTPPAEEKWVRNFGRGTAPTQAATAEEVEELRELLWRSVDWARANWADGLFKIFNPYTVHTLGHTLSNVDQAIQFNNIHESIHYGYILALKKLV